MTYTPCFNCKGPGAKEMQPWCDVCDRSGILDEIGEPRCGHCAGEGEVPRTDDAGIFWIDCPVCMGNGHGNAFSRWVSRVDGDDGYPPRKIDDCWVFRDVGDDWDRAQDAAVVDAAGRGDFDGPMDADERADCAAFVDGFEF